jgi:hypothetical protein
LFLPQVLQEVLERVFSHILAPQSKGQTGPQSNRGEDDYENSADYRLPKAKLLEHHGRDDKIAQVLYQSSYKVRAVNRGVARYRHTKLTERLHDETDDHVMRLAKIVEAPSASCREGAAAP